MVLLLFTLFWAGRERRCGRLPPTLLMGQPATAELPAMTQPSLSESAKQFSHANSQAFAIDGASKHSSVCSTCIRMPRQRRWFQGLSTRPAPAGLPLHLLPACAALLVSRPETGASQRHASRCCMCLSAEQAYRAYCHNRPDHLGEDSSRAVLLLQQQQLGRAKTKLGWCCSCSTGRWHCKQQHRRHATRPQPHSPCAQVHDHPQANHGFRSPTSIGELRGQLWCGMRELESSLCRVLLVFTLAGMQSDGIRGSHSIGSIIGDNRSAQPLLAQQVASKTFLASGFRFPAFPYSIDGHALSLTAPADLPRTVCPFCRCCACRRPLLSLSGALLKASLTAGFAAADLTQGCVSIKLVGRNNCPQRGAHTERACHCWLAAASSRDRCAPSG